MGVPIYECAACHETFHAIEVGHVIFQVNWRSWGGTKRTPICPRCAQAIHQAYDDSLRERMVCKHGVLDGMSCPECEQDYMEARRKVVAER